MSRVDKSAPVLPPGTVRPEDVEELLYIPPEREERRRKHYEEKLADILTLFEHEDRKGVIEIRDVGTVIRGVGLNPSEAVVLRVIETVEEPESTGFISVAKLSQVVMSMAMTGQFEGNIQARESESSIIAAFEMLDRDRKGYIEASYLKEVLVTMGEKFNNEEMLEMINAASDPETGHVYYEDFAVLLATE